MMKVRRVVGLVLMSGALAIPGGAMAQAPAAAPAAAAAPAGNYTVIPISEKMFANGRETSAAQTLGRNVAKVLSGEMALGDEPFFDNYYTRHLFAMYTQTDAKSLAKLPKERSNFLRNHIQRTRRPEIHDHLVQLTFRSMKDIVTNNYHPAVRYHAMMIIGDLNSKEMTTPGPNGTPPVPLAEARDFMLAELGNPKQVDGVRVAALLGILRHTEISAYGTPLPPAVKQNIVKVIQPLATDKNIPADRSPEGHAWMRSRAVEVLAHLGRPQYDAPLVQTLTTIMADSSEPTSLRFAALTSLGRMNLSGATNFTGDQLARQMAMLAVQATREQLAPIDDQLTAEKEKLRLSGGGPGGYGGGYSGGERGGYSSGAGYPGGGPGGMAGTVVKTPQQLKEEARLTIVQRVLKDHMLKTRIGLDGADGKSGAVTAAKAAAQKDYIKKVSDAVTALAKVSDMKDARTEGPPRLADLAKEIRAKMIDLDRVAKTGGAPAAPAAAPEGPEGPAEGSGESPDAVSAVPGESPDATAAVGPAAARRTP